jgi:MFS family permease
MGNQTLDPSHILKTATQSLLRRQDPKLSSCGLAAPVVPPLASAPSVRGFLPFGIVLLLALAVFINYVDRGNLATAAPLVQDELHLTNAQIGLLLSAFFWSYAPAQLLSGWLAHRFDVRYVLAGGLIVWSIATLASGLTSSFALLCALRLLLGLGESSFYPCNARLLAERTPEEQRGAANGVVSAGQALGPAFGTLAGGVLMARFGWRPVFVVLGLLSLLWLAPWLRATRNALTPRAPAVPRPTPIAYMRILRRPEVWGTGAGCFLSYYGHYFVLTWLPLYLVNARGFSVVQMAQIGALVYCIHAASCSTIGWLSDRWIKHGASTNRVRKSIVIIGSLGIAITLLGCAHAPRAGCVVLLLTAGFFFGFLQPQIFAAAQTLGGSRAAGKWMAFQNMLGNFAGVVSPLITGVVVDSTGSYGWAFAIASSTAVAAALMWGYGVRRIEPVEWDNCLVSSREITTSEDLH